MHPEITFYCIHSTHLDAHWGLRGYSTFQHLIWACFMVCFTCRHITQFEELQLLKEFEKRETMFTSRYRSKKQERSDMVAKMEEVQWAVSEKERQVGLLQEQEKALHASFSEAVGENKFKDFLLRVSPA